MDQGLIKEKKKKKQKKQNGEKKETSQALCKGKLLVQDNGITDYLTGTAKKNNNNKCDECLFILCKVSTTMIFCWVSYAEQIGNYT